MKTYKKILILSLFIGLSLNGFCSQKMNSSEKKQEANYSIEKLRAIFGQELDHQIVQLIEMENQMNELEKEQLPQAIEKAKEKNMKIQAWLQEALVCNDVFIQKAATNAKSFLQEKVHYLNRLNSTLSEGLSESESKELWKQFSQNLESFNQARNELYDHSDLLLKDSQ